MTEIETQDLMRKCSCGKQSAIGSFWWQDGKVFHSPKLCGQAGKKGNGASSGSPPVFETLVIVATPKKRKG